MTRPFFSSNRTTAPRLPLCCADATSPTTTTSAPGVNKDAAALAAVAAAVGAAAVGAPAVGAPAVVAAVARSGAGSSGADAARAGEL